MIIHEIFTYIQVASIGVSHPFINDTHSAKKNSLSDAANSEGEIKSISLFVCSLLDLVRLICNKSDIALLVA